MDKFVKVPTGGLVHFRLTDDNFDMLVNAVTWFRSASVVYYAVYEISKIGQSHIHCLLDVKNKSTFVQQFHKQFKNRWKGNKSFSCEFLKKDLENNYVYLSKGTRYKLPHVLYKKISDEDVEKYWKKYWEDKPEGLDKTITSTKSKKKVITWSQQVSIDILTKYPDREWSYCAEDVDFIFDFVMVSLGSQSKKLNAFILRDLVLGQLNAISNGKCVGLNKVLKKQAFPDLFGEI